MKIFSADQFDFDISKYLESAEIFFEQFVLKKDKLLISYFYKYKDGVKEDIVDNVNKTLISFFKTYIDEENILIYNREYLDPESFFRIYVYNNEYRFAQFKFISNNNDINIICDDNNILENLRNDEIFDNYKTIVSCFDRRNININFKKFDEDPKEFLDELSQNERIAQDSFVINRSEAKGEKEKSNKEYKSYNRKYEIIKKDTINIIDIRADMDFVTVKGTVSDLDFEERDSYAIFKFCINDNTDSIMVSKYIKKGESGEYEYPDDIKDGSVIYLLAKISSYKNNNEFFLKIIRYDLVEDKKEVFNDIERCEIGIHTKMTQLEGIDSASSFIKIAKKRGYKSIGFMDKNVVQAYPEIMNACIENKIKPLYGMEATIFNDDKTMISNYKGKEKNTFVVFDVETTGFSSIDDRIIEIGAVKIEDNAFVGSFSEFCNPSFHIPSEITNLTTIDDSMVEGKDTFDSILDKFLDFVGDAVLVAHNADFDISFLKASCIRNNISHKFEYMDTMEMSRYILPDMKNHKLDTLCKKFAINLQNHHRAVDDATATAKVFIYLKKLFKHNGIESLEQYNSIKSVNLFNTYKLSIFAQNLNGLKSLYKLVSIAHTEHLFRQPIIYKSELNKYKDNLMIGSGNYNGLLYQSAMKSSSTDELKNIIKDMDFIELQPINQYYYLFEDGSIREMENIKNINKKLYFLAKEEGKPVIANGDVYYIDKDKSIFRKILIHNARNARGSIKEANNSFHYFMTTNEMLKEFSYLGEDIAREIVVDNTLNFSNKFDEFRPIPKDTYTPKIDNADEDLRNICMKKAHKIYGDELPKIVEDRLNIELNSIIKNGYAVLYIIARNLVLKSNEAGYIVGSRGSVGSSFVATMCDITEVNPLLPHYVCPACKHSIFYEKGEYDSGFDLPEKECPICKNKMNRDGHNIPFEVFLGFNGDKEPDIDLNFAGDYQLTAHKNAEELFGEGYVYRAGTIGGVAEKTAIAYIRDYYDDVGESVSYLRAKYLAKVIDGTKRTTGQHAGGVMVVPKDKDILDFTPIQFPADDINSKTKTTHFDYNAISGKILKLDLLGHDVPNIIKNIEDMTNTSISDIPFDNEKVLSLFNSCKVLGVTPEQIGTPVGTYGIPEFGTNFVRNMLIDTKPSNFSDLVRISGLSHGTNVWNKNAEELIRTGRAKINQVISTREDIMNNLIRAGMDNSTAFTIMELVRKGKKLKFTKYLDNGESKEIDYNKLMMNFDLPEWYLESCAKISYLFPKAHAVAYVMMSYRLAYYKIFYPQEFYATYFSEKVNDFDYDILVKNFDEIDLSIKKLQKDIQENVNTIKKDKDKLPLMEIGREMKYRGIRFKPIDIYLSEAKKFIVKDGYIIPPFTVIPGLGIEPANRIIEQREKRQFTSIQDLQTRINLNNTVVKLMQEWGLLENLPKTDQICLF